MEPIKTYACYLKDDDVRMSSSSGAVFSALASCVFSLNGIIYGVAMSEDCYSAVFTSATNMEELKKLRCSKYLQAKVGNTYRNVQRNLIDGRIVLFTGTGCQVNGLKNFLGRDYENLICVDVVCHGAPSPALWREYVRYQEQKNGGKLKYVNFRCKDKNWSDFGMEEVIYKLQEDEIKRQYISKDDDPYMQMFLRDYCLRPSCYECVAKNVKKSDITIADFWGIERIAPEMVDNKGTSLVIIRTQLGRELFNKVSENMRVKEVSYKDGVKYNPAEYKSPNRPKQRDTFFSDMARMHFDEMIRKYALPIRISKKRKVIRKMKSVVKTVFNFVRGGSNSEYGLLFVFHI